jgi:hypothetical protein
MEIFGFQDKNGRYLWVDWGHMTCLASVPNHAPRAGMRFLLDYQFRC